MPKPKPFSLRTQQISQGKFDGLMARGDLLEVRLKIYAEGGENTLRLAYSGVTPEQIDEGVSRLAEAVHSLGVSA